MRFIVRTVYFLWQETIHFLLDDDEKIITVFAGLLNAMFQEMHPTVSCVQYRSTMFTRMGQVDHD